MRTFNIFRVEIVFGSYPRLVENNLRNGRLEADILSRDRSCQPLITGKFNLSGFNAKEKEKHTRTLVYRDRRLVEMPSCQVLCNLSTIQYDHEDDRKGML